MTTAAAEIRTSRSSDIHVASRFPLTGREFALAAACWALFAVFRVADLLVAAPSVGAAAHSTLPAAGESACWLALTPFVVAAVEWAASRRLSRSAQVVLYAALGVLAAAAIGGVGRWLATLGYGPGTAPGPAPGLGPSPAPYWFWFGNACGLYLAVVSAALARASALRARTQRERAAELEAHLAAARLDALRRQLDPHFLFNTHALVASLVEDDPAGARRMLARLGELLRVSLRDADGQEVTLEQELALVDLYLDIMRVRYEERLTVEVHVVPAVRDALVPSLVLQPLVENAIKHGVERRPGRGRVVLEAARDGAALILRVWDGEGREPGTPSDPQVGTGDGTSNAGALGAGTPDARGGVGLRNTAARLDQLYGASARVTLGPAADGGMEAVVRLPFHTVPRHPGPPTRVPTDATRAQTTAADPHARGSDVD